MRRVVLVLLVIIVAIGLFVGLHPLSPTRTSDDFEHKAKNTAESVLSSVQTARLAARVATRGDAFGPFVSVLLSESDTGVAKAQGEFESLQPPNHHSDRVRDRLDELLTRASDDVARLRITARRGELTRLQRQARPLRALASELRDFIDDPGAL